MVIMIIIIIYVIMVIMVSHHRHGPRPSVVAWQLGKEEEEEKLRAKVSWFTNQYSLGNKDVKLFPTSGPLYLPFISMTALVKWL